MQPSIGKQISDNPYAAPLSTEFTDGFAQGDGDVLAARFSRFAAALVDGFLYVLFTVPAQMILSSLFGLAVGSTGMLAPVIWYGGMLLLNGYTLVTRGQSLGKLLIKIQVVDAESGNLLPLSRVFFYRQLWLLPLGIIAGLIPGTIDDRIYQLVILIDVLMIFGANRRCLHDHIAGSKVVMYRGRRTRM